MLETSNVKNCASLGNEFSILHFEMSRVLTPPATGPRNESMPQQINLCTQEN